MDESNETAPSPTNKNSSWSCKILSDIVLFLSMFLNSDGPGSNLYIRSRSQSPSQLAIQLLKEGGSPYSNESPHYSQVMLPPSKASQWNDSPADDSNSKFNNGYRRREVNPAVSI
jgi:hypothetical protein